MSERVGRFEESIEIMRRSWSGEEFSFHGTHFDLDALHVRPAPYSPGGPPLWIGASTVPGARRAGRLADGFVAGPSTDLRGTQRLLDAYRQAALDAGREPRVVLMRDAWVASSRSRGGTGLRPGSSRRLQVLLEERAGRIPQHPVWSPTLPWNVLPTTAWCWGALKSAPPSFAAGAKRRDLTISSCVFGMPTPEGRLTSGS